MTPKRALAIGLALVLVFVGGLVVGVSVDRSETPPGPSQGPKGSSSTPSPRPSATSPSPSPVGSQATSSPSGPVSTEPTGIKLTHLTDGFVFKEGPVLSAETAPVFLDDGRVTLVHLFSCCDHADAPVVRAGETTFDLVVTHTTGEKRHWVFRAVGADTTAPITFTFTFEVPQGIVEWIVDAASGVPTTNNGADAIGATAWQNSMANASSGSLDVPATRGAVVGFSAMGSGKAREVVPGPGFVETAESSPSSYQIATFWSRSPTTNVAATFVDDSGTPQIMSWLLLAVELLPR